MNRLKLFAVAFTLTLSAFTVACDVTCETCDLQPGTVIRFVDADSVVHDFTAGQDGCIRFEAEDCRKYEAIEIKKPALEESSV